MSIKSIAPIYKKWVQEINKGTIKEKTRELSKEFNEIVHDILYSDKKNKQINKEITDIRKRLLYLELASNQIPELSSDITEGITKLASNMDLVNKYEERETMVGQKQSLNILTYISVIFLPLTLITGYFGMNLRDQGNLTEKRGIMALKYGQLFIFFLGTVSIIASILILNRYYKVK